METDHIVDKEALRTGIIIHGVTALTLITETTIIEIEIMDTTLIIEDADIIMETLGIRRRRKTGMSPSPPNWGMYRIK